MVSRSFQRLCVLESDVWWRKPLLAAPGAGRFRRKIGASGMVSRSIEWEGHGATSSKRASSWLTGTAFTGAFVTIVAAFPQSALAACLGENTGSVTCDAANPASGGALTSSFGG